MLQEKEKIRYHYICFNLIIFMQWNVRKKVLLLHYNAAYINFLLRKSEDWNFQIDLLNHVLMSKKQQRPLCILILFIIHALHMMLILRNMALIALK